MESACFSEASFDSERGMDAPVFATSADAGWTSVLLERRRSVPVHEAFETGVTPDQRIIVLTRGAIDIAAFGNGRWRQTTYQAGSSGMTPGGQSSRLRWASRRQGETSDTAHLYIPQASIDDAIDHFRRIGARHHEGALNGLGFDDPAVASTVRAMALAMAEGATDFYAQAATQWLTIHLLERHSAWRGQALNDRDPGFISDARLQRTLEYMSANLARSLMIEDLAAEAGVSKFHFTRLFRERIGESPIRHLTALRMRAARQLLLSTDLSLASIAGRCGYARPQHFSAAFVRFFGMPPGAFRKHQRAHWNPRD